MLKRVTRRATRWGLKSQQAFVMRALDASERLVVAVGVRRPCATSAHLTGDKIELLKEGTVEHAHLVNHKGSAPLPTSSCMDFARHHVSKLNSGLLA